MTFFAAIFAAPRVVAIGKWAVAGGWRYLAGGAAVVLVIAAFAATYMIGFEHAESRCEAVALRAQVEKLTRERDAARGLLVSASATIAALHESDLNTTERLAQLKKDLEEAQQQRSSGEGKKNDPAFLDAQCRLTPRGVRASTRRR